MVNSYSNYKELMELGMLKVEIPRWWFVLMPHTMLRNSQFIPLFGVYLYLICINAPHQSLWGNKVYRHSFWLQVLDLSIRQDVRVADP